MQKRAFLLSMMVFFLSGCINPDIPPLPLQPSQHTQITDNRWWEEFQDTNLNQLIDDALKESLSLAAAKERVLQAYATLQMKRASTMPSLGATGTAGRQDELKGVESQKDTYTATLNASYEIDLFGKKEDATNASEASFKAMQEALHVSSISLAAEISIAWYTLAQKQESLVLLQEQIKVAQKILTITKLTHERGKNSITDVWQQEQYIKSLEAQVLTLQADTDTQIRSLNILLGRSPLSALPSTSQAKLIPLPPIPDVGIPATKLLARPDVQQAFYTLQSAHYDLAEAIKNQYPSFSISLSTLASSTQFSNLLDTIIATATGTISGTLYDGGNKEALVKKARFITKERSYTYQQTLIVAFNETLEAAHKESMQTRYNTQLDERLKLARSILERQQTKYLYGIVEYLNVLSAQQSLQDLEQMKLSKELENIKYRIALYRSLGGAFITHDVDKEWKNYDN
ncbi:MAG: TolC family protein [Sulfurospirillaceae bacterium]|nr:TolC family protein [Sulfurospirillaceae bacterium]MDD2826400.1 TolC family protein [Sulfurospirillaceae bacterium]